MATYLPDSVNGSKPEPQAMNEALANAAATAGHAPSILMAAGVGGLVLFFYFWNQRRAPQPVAPVKQRRVNSVPRTYDDPTPPPPTVNTVTPQPQSPTTPLTVTPEWPPPAQATAVPATAPVVASSQGRPEGG